MNSLKFTPPQRANLRSLTEMQQLFVQVWREALDFNTNPSWQVRTMNIRTILDELLRVVTIAVDHERSRANIPFVVDEARHIARGDPIITRHFPFVRGHLDRLEENKLSSCRTTATIARGLLHGYESHIEQAVREELITRSNSKEKQYVTELTLAYATDRHCAGFARDYLDQQIFPVLEGENFAAEFSQFVNRCKTEKRAFKVYFLTQVPDSLKRPEFNIQGLPESPRDKHPFFADRQNQLYMSIPVEARDPYSACRAAAQRSERLFSTIRFHTTSTGHETVGKEALVVCSKDSHDPLSIEIPHHRNRVPQARGDKAKAIANSFELLARLKPGEAEKLQAALRHYSLALKTEAEPASLINMWIALESLVRGGEGSISSASVAGSLRPWPRDIPMSGAKHWRCISRK